MPTGWDASFPRTCSAHAARLTLRSVLPAAFTRPA